MLNLCLWIGNISNGLLLGNASIARGLTCCKKLARHEASRKLWSTKFPLGGEVNHIWPLAYIVLHWKKFTCLANKYLDALVSQIAAFKVHMTMMHKNQSIRQDIKLCLISVRTW